MNTLDFFLRDIAGHKIKIIFEHGIHRHIKFETPGTSSYRFDIITWPGHLCFSGDMGTYVFSRTQDMFEFFRKNEKDDPYKINFIYWAEKTLSSDVDFGITEFTDKAFNDVVKNVFFSWLKENRASTDKNERKILWEEIKQDILHAEWLDIHEKILAANDFSFQFKNGDFFEFVDFLETDCEEHTFHFKWVCYALQWAIDQYDHLKEMEVT
jgi:hypothetical protein